MSMPGGVEIFEKKRAELMRKFGVRNVEATGC